MTSDLTKGQANTVPKATVLCIHFCSFVPLDFKGKMEERLPLLSFYLPRRLIRSWPEARVSLHQNRARLVTLFDVHATLRHLLHWQTNRQSDFKPEPFVYTNRSSRGNSLFVELPINRGCAEAHIPPQWCTCLNWYPVRLQSYWPKRLFDSVWKPWISQVAMAVVDRLNRQIKSAQCMDPVEVRCKKLRFLEVSTWQAIRPLVHMCTDCKYNNNKIVVDGGIQFAVRFLTFWMKCANVYLHG